MQYGIQRRHIYLVPPSEGERTWIAELFDQEEVWSMFGWDGPGRARIEALMVEGDLTLGIIKKVEDGERIGFIIVFPPAFDRPWEFGIVIPEVRHRDAWSAIAAGDSVAHYMFDHCRIESCTWRIREDNGPSAAIATRMGFRPFVILELGGHRFKLYRMDTERWHNRRDRLERYDAEHPTPAGDTFVTLEGPDYAPVR